MAFFGRECFLNDVIWAYDYGGRTKKKWPAKHDNILVYVRDPEQYFFNVDEVERIPYLAPGLIGPEKAARGKLPTDTWWHTIVPTNGKERTGYPTRKPLGIVRRIVQASSKPGDTVLDFFAGSGTLGEAAYELGRRFVLIDDNDEAQAVMAERFADMEAVRFVGLDTRQYQLVDRQGQLLSYVGSVVVLRCGRADRTRVVRAIQTDRYPSLSRLRYRRTGRSAP